MRLLVQARQAVCDRSLWLLVALVLGTHLEPLVPCLRGASAHQQQDGKGQLKSHNLSLFHCNAAVKNVSFA